MRKIGMYLAIFGLGSMVLSFLDRNFIIMMWIDKWGETTGWIIRGAFIVLGIILFVLGGSGDEDTSPDTGAAE